MMMSDHPDSDNEADVTWSMMHWTVLAKSPNCASHSTRALGLVME